MKNNFITSYDTSINVEELVTKINNKTSGFDKDSLDLESSNLNRSSTSFDLNNVSPDIIHLAQLPKSHKSGIVSKLNNLVIKKVYYMIRNTLDHLLGHQQHLNHTFFRKLKEIDDKLPGDNNLDFDYLGFENIHRGSMEEISKRQSGYLNYFSENSTVVDIGCGRGEFLDCLKSKNINAIGVDTNQQMIDFCTSRGHMVFKEDMIGYLNDLQNKVDGIFAAQVIEHLHYNKIIEFIKLSFSKLNSGGKLIMETLNVQVLIPHLGAYYTDPTHKNFIHPETLKFICLSAGFSEIEILYLSPLADEDKLQIDESMSEIQKSNIEKLNGLIYGPRDFAVVAKK